MNDPILKEIKTPLARELAELVLLEADIKASRDAFRFWFSKYAGRKDELTAEEYLISLSLFRDSIVLLVGCFYSTLQSRFRHRSYTPQPQTFPIFSG
jgi:hypothetical protein